jgi:hypothetical protein
LPTIEQVHGVDRHFHVGGILALGQVELLLRFQRMAMDQFRPALERGLAPVAVDSPDIDGAEIAQDGQRRVEVGGEALSASISKAILRPMRGFGSGKGQFLPQDGTAAQSW